MVNTGSQFERTMMDQSLMLHTNFRRIHSTGSGEEEFKGVLSYMGMAAILVMSIILINIHFHVTKSLHTKCLRKASFNFHITFGQGQEITLALNTRIPSFIQLAVCIYQLSGHMLQQFLKNPLFSLFLSYQILPLP